jgi:aminoglycoside 6'-N-acetyltransferase I
MDFEEIIVKQIPPEKADYDLLLLADPSLKIVESYLDKSEIFIAESNNETLGTIVLLPIGNSTLEIKNLVVSISHQNKGIGKFLLEHAASYALKNKFSKLRICTGNSSLGQLALYQKTGFHIRGEVKNFFPEHYPEPIIENGIQCIDLIILEKEISSS